MLGLSIVADNWISLAQAFEMMLASEKDPLLVERLLIPALWIGIVPAISRRALVEGRRTTDLNLVTKHEWEWEESPILFDWTTSRGWLPSGFYRKTPISDIILFEKTEYYVIEVEKTALIEFLPEITDPSNSVSSRRAGRPSLIHVIGPEIDRRELAGERHGTQMEWATNLRDWYLQAYGNSAPPLSAKRIANFYGERLGQLKPAPNLSKPPKPKNK